MTKSLFRNDGEAAALQLHDQTEASDGDRRRQREGWPARAGDVPAPRDLADAVRHAGGGDATR